jgi:hypothetical protein
MEVLNLGFCGDWIGGEITSIWEGFRGLFDPQESTSWISWSVGFYRN